MRSLLITILLTTLIFPQQSKLSRVGNYLSAIITFHYKIKVLFYLLKRFSFNDRDEYFFKGHR